MNSVPQYCVESGAIVKGALTNTVRTPTDKSVWGTSYKEKWPIFISQVVDRPGFGEKVNN